MASSEAASPDSGALDSSIAQLEGGGWTQDRGYELLGTITAAARHGDRAALKTIALRDQVVALLCGLCKQQLGPPLRRRLAEAMCAVIDAEGRAVLPIVDGVMQVLETMGAQTGGKGQTVAASAGARVTGLHCLERVLAHIGIQALSRLPALLAISRAAVKPGEPAPVRARGVRALVAGIAAAAQGGRTAHEEALKLAKALLVDRLAAVRAGARELLLAVLRAAPQPHDLHAEKVLATLAATLEAAGPAPAPGGGAEPGTARGERAEGAAEAEARHAATVLGQALAVLALAGAPPAEAPGRVKMAPMGFRKPRKPIVGTAGALAFLRAALLAARPASPARVALARAHRALLAAVAREAGEAEAVAPAAVGTVLDLALSPSGAKAPPLLAARHVACCVGEALAASRAFSEEAQQLLARALLDEVARRARDPAAREAPGQAVAVACAAQELARVLLDLGGVHGEPEHVELLLPLLASPFAPLRASVAVALRALVRPPPAPPPARPPPRVRGSATERARGGGGQVSAAPALTVLALRALLAVLHAEAEGAGAPGEGHAEHAHGASLAMAGVMMAARAHTHGLPCDLLDSVCPRPARARGGGGERRGRGGDGARGQAMSMAHMAVRMASGAEGGAEAVLRLEGAWAVVCACLRMGAEWVATFEPLLVQMWEQAVTAASEHDGKAGLPEPEAEWRAASLAGTLASLTVRLGSRAPARAPGGAAAGGGRSAAGNLRPEWRAGRCW